MTEGVTFAERPRRVCVIGAGLSGLALALRLQAAGIETVLVEARDAVGGRSGGFERAGFHFDRGPAALTGRQAPLTARQEGRPAAGT